jgi:3-hydroxypropanoate dehydrogenase
MENNQPLDQQAFDTLFREARTYNGWQDRDVPESLVREIYDLMKWGPTSANCCPLRIVFVRSEEAKEKLKPMLDKGNQDKTMEAPVVALFAYDRKFYEKMSKLAPHVDTQKWYGGKDALVAETAWRNGTLQAAYFLLAARAKGIDCGPMSGFSKDKVKAEFFPGLDGDVNFICALGYGRPETLHPRAKRLDFEEAAKFV